MWGPPATITSEEAVTSTRVNEAADAPWTVSESIIQTLTSSPVRERPDHVGTSLSTEASGTNMSPCRRVRRATCRTKLPAPMSVTTVARRSQDRLHLVKFWVRRDSLKDREVLCLIAVRMRLNFCVYAV